MDERQQDGDEQGRGVGSDWGRVPPPLPGPPPIPGRPRPPRRPPTPSGGAGGLSGATLGLGVVSLFLSFMVVGGVFAVIGLVCGLSHLAIHHQHRVRALIGIFLCAGAIVISLSQYFVLSRFVFDTGFISMMGEAMGKGGVNRWVGVKAPDFQVVCLDGKPIKLGDYQGRRVVIHVFDNSVENQLRHLQRLAREHPEIAVLGFGSEEEWKLKTNGTLASGTYPVACARDLNEPYRRFSYGEALLFIDRKGVIQSIQTIVPDYGSIVRAATAGDYEGPVNPAPTGVLVNAVDAPLLRKPEKLWTRPAEGVINMVTGDWNGDGAEELIALSANKVECIDAAGNTVGEWTPPQGAKAVRFGKCGREARLLAWTFDSVYVHATDGKYIWSKTGSGVDGCCFVDVDGQGCDSVLAGLGSFSGRLMLLTPEGKQAWSVGGSMLDSFSSVSGVRTAKGELFLVAARMMGGVQRYSASGRKLEAIGPRNANVSVVACAEMDGQGGVQVLGWGDEGYVAAMDGRGEGLWRCLARSAKDERRGDQLACGDWDGDGVKEWTIPGRGEILVVSAAGQIICHTGIDYAAAAILNRKGQGGLLVLGNNTEITAYTASVN